MKKLFELNKRLSEARNVVLYGAGYYGKKMYDFLVCEGVGISYFCDSNKEAGQKFEGVEIVSPEKLLEMSDLCIVITGAKAWDKIYDKLLKMSIPKEDIISHIGLNNLCILNKELLETKDIFISGTDENSLRVFYKLLVEEIGIEGFLDEKWCMPGDLLNRRVLKKDAVENWENKIIIGQPTGNIGDYPQEATLCIDNSFKGYFGKDLCTKAGRIDIKLLHDLKRLKGNRKLVIYGTDEYAWKSYKILQLLDYDVAFFVDTMGSEKQIDNKPVCSVYDLMYHSEKYYIFVCVQPKDYENVIFELKGLGYHEGYDYIPAWERGLDNIYDPNLGYVTITVESGKEYDGFYTFTAGRAEKKYKILVLGGSTSDPYCVQVKLWCEILRDICLENNFNVEIVTGGVMGYSSAQELVKLIRDGINLNANLVISYSGANDIYERGEYPFLNTFQKEVCVLFDKSERGIKSSRGLKRKGVEAYNEWLQNERMMYAILNEFHVPFMSVYQPVLWSKKGNLTVEEIGYETLHKSLLINAEVYEKAIENANIARTKVVEDSRNIEWLNDFSAIFDGQSEVYVDVVHCTEKGNRLIAEKMFELLEERLKKFFK